MANERKERVVVTQQGDYARRDRVVEYERSTQSIIVSRLNQLIGLMVIIINVFLMIRFTMLLIAANANNMFVNFVYTVTDIFVTPFQNILANPALANGGIIEFGSVIGIIVYALLGWILVTLIGILFSDAGGTRYESSYEQRS